MASRAILSNFFEEQRTQNLPQYPSGLSCALFPTTFLEIAVYTFYKSTLPFSLLTTVFSFLQPDGTELFHFVDGYPSWDAYLTSMMADGTWGDHVILHGAANCFQTCIYVISSLPHRHEVMICPEFDVSGGNRLVLGHVHELHYVSLIPQIGGKDVWLYCDIRVTTLQY